MANPANDHGKVIKDSRKTSPHDNFSQMQELENLDVLNTFWARIVTRSDEYFDQYTVDIFPDEQFRGEAIAENCLAFTVDLRRYSVSERVRVYWRPATQFAIIFMRSPFGFLKLTADWKPNEDRITGKRATIDGGILEPDSPDVVVSLTGSGQAIAYCPFKKDMTITYWRWPFDAPNSWVNPRGFDGVCMSFPQIPMPTAMHQVLTCVGAENLGGSLETFRIAWGALRTMDRINGTQDTTPDSLE